MKSTINNHASIKRHIVAGLALFVLIAGGVGAAGRQRRKYPALSLRQVLSLSTAM